MFRLHYLLSCGTLFFLTPQLQYATADLEVAKLLGLPWVQDEAELVGHFEKTLADAKSACSGTTATHSVENSPPASLHDHHPHGHGGGSSTFHDGPIFHEAHLPEHHGGRSEHHDHDHDFEHFPMFHEEHRPMHHGGWSQQPHHHGHRHLHGHHGMWAHDSHHNHGEDGGHHHGPWSHPHHFGGGGFDSYHHPHGPPSHPCHHGSHSHHVREKSQRRRYADLSRPLPLGLPPWRMESTVRDGACVEAIDAALMERLQLSPVIRENDENEVALRFMVVLVFITLLSFAYLLVLSWKCISESSLAGTPFQKFLRLFHWVTLVVCVVFITIVNPTFWVVFIPVYGTARFIQWTCRRDDVEEEENSREYQLVNQAEEDSKKPHVVEAIPVV